MMPFHYLSVVGRRRTVKAKGTAKQGHETGSLGGLSHAEAKEYDERQQRIMKIVTTLEGQSPKA
jgi:hypothetical protein